MADETLPDELLSQWKREAARGRDLAATELCREHPELVAELERRIRAARQMDTSALPAADPVPPAARADPISTAPLDPFATRCDTALEAPQAPAAGDGLGIPGYTVLATLGRGGMGVVYKARQTNLGRTVALKMILSGAHAGPDDLARFRTEAEAIARLQHPNIVQIFEVGEQGGLPFFSLEFCGGGSLDRKLAGTPLPPQGAARLVEALARATQAAHDRGVLHRDLKPANVLLADDGTPKITDFGLAKKLDEVGRTASGEVMGTPSYMAPEQAGGKSKEIGPACDIYALGAILYECLTGRPPFKAATAVDTLMQVVSEEPVPPSRVRANVPRDLQTICMKCLEKERARRYRTAADLAEDLCRFQAGEPIRARDLRFGERLLKLAYRRPALFAAWSLSVLAVVLAGLGTGAAWLWQRAEQARREADAARNHAEEARAQAVASEGVAEQARRETEQARQQLIRLNYLRQVDLAHREWHEGHVRRSLALVQGCDPALRHWEWGYVNHLCRAYLLNFKAHTSTSEWYYGGTLAYSPDGRSLATGGDSGDPTVKVWDAQTGRETLTLKGHSGGIYSVAFSPDGRRIASASQDNTVKVWDVEAGREALTLGHTGGVSSVAFSPDGKRIATASQNKSVKVWDAQSGNEMFSVKGNAQGVRRLAFSPDGDRIAAASYDKTVKVWDAHTGDMLLSNLAHADYVEALAFSPDGTKIASAGRDQTVKVWDARTGKNTLTLVGHVGFILTVAYSPDGKRLGSAGADQTVKVWEAVSGRQVLSLKGHTSTIGTVAFSRDGKRIASASLGTTVKVFDAVSSQEARTMKGDSYVRNVSLSPAGDRIAGACYDNTVKVWETRTGKVIHNLSGHRNGVYSVAYSPDGKSLASGGFDQLVKVWDAQSGQETLTLEGHTQTVTSVAFSPDGKYLASAGGNLWGGKPGEVKLWDARSGRVILSFQGHTRGVFGVAFSPDGKRLASGSEDTTVKVWDVQTGRETLSLEGHTSVVFGVAFSPDGKRLASAGRDTSVKVWDSCTGKEILSLEGHANEVYGVAFSHDGKRIASIGWDQSIRIWDAETGQPVLSLKCQSSAGWSVAFSPDGKRIASSSGSVVQLWDTLIDE
ncbi:MAG TPA: protein kinase [Gemmataceae bacterium]|nr:protein kinase [Gemmataceae bacterium]